MDSLPDDDGEAIEQQAARWLVRRETAAWADADHVEFERWLQRTAHRVAYLRLEAAWQQAARLRALAAGLPAGTVPPRGSWGRSLLSRGKASAAQSTRRVSLPVRRALQRAAKARIVAAACLLGLIAPSLVGLVLHNRNLYATPVGGTKTVRLDDGSEMTLNTDTLIHVAMTPRVRRIRLNRGEAYFHVAKDAARPFVVYAGAERVVAVGTQFAVRRAGGDVSVIVTEGRVRLLSREPGPSTYVSAGSLARASKQSVVVRSVARSDAARLLSWRSGYLIFDDTTLADAVEELNRYSRRRIVITDPSIAAIRIGGNVRFDNIDGFIWLLQRGFPIAAEQSDERIVLERR